MKKKIQKSDIGFVIAIILVFLFYALSVFSFPFLEDETFYLSIPFRLIQGDHLVQHEWHLSQFSSLFTYLPVRIWTAITGSCDGLILFSRLLFLSLYTLLAVVTYRFFRHSKGWAVWAVLFFFSQTPYRILGLSYNSVYTICVLLFTLCLLAIQNKPARRYHVFAGFCYGCCCVCNPIVCLLLPLYIIAWFLWTRCIKGRIQENARETGDRFLNRNAVLLSISGFCVVILAAIAFFLLTGGTFSAVFANYKNLLGSSEYSLGAGSLFKKIATALQVFYTISLKMPYFLILLYVALFVDKKRFLYRHRILYLLAAVVFSAPYIVGIYLNTGLSQDWYLANAFSLPLGVLSTTCYILTEKKNKNLFFFMWLPAAVAAAFQFIASNSLLTAFSFVFTVSNIAGVFFIRDLYKEMAHSRAQNTTAKQKPSPAARFLIGTGLALQILVHILVLLFGHVLDTVYTQATVGPCAGLFLTRTQTTVYNTQIQDLDIVKAKTPQDAPVLMITGRIWMYLYIDRPSAIYTSWFDGVIQPDHLSAYYTQNPDKIPQYIYLEWCELDTRLAYLETLDTIFDFTVEELPDGLLLTVTGHGFS